MTAQDWNAYISTLDSHDRLLAQSIMDRVVTVLERYRSHTLRDIQEIKRENAALKKQLRDLRDQVEANGSTERH